MVRHRHPNFKTHNFDFNQLLLSKKLELGVQDGKPLEVTKIDESCEKLTKIYHGQLKNNEFHGLGVFF